MSKMGSFGVVRGNSRSLKIAPFDRLHTISFHINNTILHRFRNTVRYWSKTNNLMLSHLHLARLLGVPLLEFRWDLWHQKTTVNELSYGVVCVILRVVVWYNISVLQTNEHDDSIYCANIASHGKNTHNSDLLFHISWFNRTYCHIKFQDYSLSFKLIILTKSYVYNLNVCLVLFTQFSTVLNFTIYCQNNFGPFLSRVYTNEVWLRQC